MFAWVGRRRLISLSRNRPNAGIALGRCRRTPGLGSGTTVERLVSARDCAQTVPMVFADEKELFPVVRAAACLRQKAGDLPGTVRDMNSCRLAARVRAARSFLSGADTVLQSLSERSRHRRSRGVRAACYVTAGSLFAGCTRVSNGCTTRRRHSFIYPVAGSVNARCGISYTRTRRWLDE